jgi:hypothetical protein
MKRINKRNKITRLSPYTKAHRFKQMTKKITDSAFFHFFQLCSIVIGVLILFLSLIFFAGGPDGRRSSPGTVLAIVFFILGIAIIYFAVNWRNTKEKRGEK